MCEISIRNVLDISSLRINISYFPTKYLDPIIFSSQRDLFVSFYNLPRVEKIRSMRTDKVGRCVLTECFLVHYVTITFYGAQFF